MADIELARAYVEIIPVTKGISDKTREQVFPGEKDGTKAADKAGRGFSNRLGSVLKKTMLGAGIALGGIFTTSLVKGFGRLSAIENAEAKLKGLGNSAADTSAIMENALASVKGTAFGMDEAATTAASAVAAGVKPGQELESYLRLVGDAATIAGTDMQSMGSIFGKVMTSGKAQGEVFQQLGDAGIPIVSLLAESMGITAEEVYKLGSAGKITSADFLKAMSSMEGAAQAGGETTTGAAKNMMAALSRFGANMLTGIFPLVGPFFNQITALLDGASAAVTPWIESITPKLQAAADTVLGYMQTVTGSIDGILAVFRSGDFDPSLWAEGISEDSPLVDLAFRIRDAWASVSGFVAPIIASIRDAITSALPHIASAVDWFRELSVGAQALFAGGAIVGGLAMFGKLGSTLGLLAGKVKGVLGPLGKFTPLLRFLGGPVGLIVGSLVTLIATNDEVRASFTNLLEVLGGALGTTLEALIPVAIQVAEALGPALGAAALAVGGALQAAAPHIATVVDWLAKLIQWLEPALPVLLPLIAGIWAWQKAMIAQRIATVAATIASKAMLVWTKATMLASKAAAAAQWLWNAALTANPIGLIIAGIAALAAGLYLFFTKTETGRAIWEKVWGAIKGAAKAVADWFMGTALPVLKAAWDGIASGALWLYHNAILPAWNGIRVAVAAVVDWVMGTAVPWLQSAWTAIATAAKWLYQNVLVPVWEGIRIAIALVVAAVMTYVELWVAFFRGVVAPLFTWLWNTVIVPVWNGIRAAISAVVTWFQTTAWPLISTVIGWVRARFEDMKLGLAIIWAFVRDKVIAPVVAWLLGTAWPMIQRVISLVRTGFDMMKLGLQVIWAFIRDKVIAPVVSWLLGTAWPTIQRVIGYVRTGFDLMKLGLQVIWAFIRDRIIAPVVSWLLGTAWPTIQRVIGYIRLGFDTMKLGLQTIWNFIKDRIIQPVVSWFQNTVQPAITRVTDKIKSSFDTMKDGIKSAWDKVKAAARTPIEFVIKKVYNEGLKDNFNNVAEKMGISTRLPTMHLPAGFRTGGILPGQSRMRDGDDQLVPMRRGEGVIVSEALRTVRDKSLFLAANAAGRSGVSFSSWLGRIAGGGFAGGGIVDWLKGASGDTIDWIQDKGGFLADALLDPKGALSKLVDTLTSSIPGGGMVRDLAVKVPKKIIGDVASKLFDFTTGPDGAVPAGGGGRGGSLGAAESLAKAMGLVITSRGRRGARTAQNGLVSLHALGRAIDVAGSKANMMAYFNAVDARWRPTELLYSPAGARNLHRSGRRYPNRGATLRNHYSHVHVGFNKGGIFDNGGWLQPGEVGVNLSNRPEPVFTGAQWDLMEASLADGGKRGKFGDITVQVENRHGDDPTTFGRRVGESLDLSLLALEGV